MLESGFRPRPKPRIDILYPAEPPWCPIATLYDFALKAEEAGGEKAV